MRKTIAHGITGWASVINGLACTLLAFAVAANAQAELPSETDEAWTLRKKANDIRVYTIDQPDSSFKAFKAVAVLDAPIENLMAVMANPGSCVEWVYNCTESYAFGDGEFRDRFAYSVNDMPWPVTDRDYVLRIRTRGDETSGEIVMDLNATPNQRTQSSSRIRVDRSDTLYRFTPDGDKTRMGSAHRSQWRTTGLAGKFPAGGHSRAIHGGAGTGCQQRKVPGLPADLRRTGSTDRCKSLCPLSRQTLRG